MSSPQPRPPRMSVEDYLAWEATQEEKWELVDGFPVLRQTRLMAGGTAAHARIAANLIGALFPRLRGGQCTPYTADLKVKAEQATRYPDVTVDCGTEHNSLTAQQPRVIFEVLSPSNNAFQQNRLLTDYQSIETVEQIVFVSQDAPQAQTWRRVSNGWTLEEIEGVDAAIELPSVAVEIPMIEIYDGVA